MSKYIYLDVVLKLPYDSVAVITPIYFLGSINNSLQELFGEIGGETELELIKFDSELARGIIRVPEEFATRTRSAITLIGHFQSIPCHFEVTKSSKEPLDF